MAQVIKRVWRAGPRKVKRVAWGYTLQVNGKQVRKFNSEWATADDAQKALSAVLLGLEPVKAKDSGITFGEAVERYKAVKARKRTLVEDSRMLGHLTDYFGKDAPLPSLTASRISEYKASRLSAVRKIGEGENAIERGLTAAAVNRPLALLRHLLRIAHEEWEVLESVPRIRLEKEPQGRVRWLEPETAGRLLNECRKSRNTALADLVEFTMFTGLRRGEALALTWEKVNDDRSRGVVRVEVTKNGHRREVPLNANADAVLARRWSEGAKGWVFGSHKWNAFRSAWEAAVERAGLEDFRYHDLRHCYASWLVQRGRTLKEVQELLGHRTVSMTNRYAHLSTANRRQAVAVLDDVFPAPKSESSAHKSAHEPVMVEGVSQKSS